MNGLVSVIMPSYNTAAYIAESIRSVLAQTYENWELIIVDDCSDDGTDDAVRPFLTDSRIKYLKNAVNSGAAVSRNYALREARGKWIAFLDSDDLWLPEKLERQIAFMEKNGYKFTYTRYRETDEMSRDGKTLITGPKKITRRKMYAYCWVGCLTVMYDAETIGLIQIEDIKKNNDYAMWLKICKKADCHLLDETLAKYRKRSGSISNHGRLSLIKWHYRLFRFAEHKSVCLSAVLTLRNLFWGLYKKLVFKKSEEN